MYFIVADDRGMVREAPLPFIQQVDPLAVILQVSIRPQAAQALNMDSQG